MATTSSSSGSSMHSFEANIASLDHEAIVQLALSTHDPHASANMACTVLTPPEHGAPDDTRCVMRIPFGEWTATRARSMRLNVVAQQHIQSHASVPIPRIHAYDCSTANVLGHLIHNRRLCPAAGLWTCGTTLGGGRVRARRSASYGRSRGTWWTSRVTSYVAQSQASLVAAAKRGVVSQRRIAAR
ncbi:hypothetical protein FA95DRAFT_1611653 [Auriscalpium vulgare]|uniref:Uncharacterized protein n=1 Tax=Auriscalpium vulgare TaxID=40419 RepID=A0ACB8RA07_9AGAM|nr:hypothetical protein FA95DRAFT_1611653 [Auriscalpium vulgare]